MRSLVYDEISGPDMEKLQKALSERLETSGLMGEVYWMPLEGELLSGEQQDHAEDCGPHRVAVVLDEESMRLELLIRAEQKMRCTCVSYASHQQRELLLRYMDGLMDELGINT